MRRRGLAIGLLLHRPRPGPQRRVDARASPRCSPGAPAPDLIYPVICFLPQPPRDRAPFPCLFLPVLVLPFLARLPVPSGPLCGPRTLIFGLLSPCLLAFGPDPALCASAPQISLAAPLRPRGRLRGSLDASHPSPSKHWRAAPSPLRALSGPLAPETPSLWHPFPHLPAGPPALASFSATRRASISSSHHLNPFSLRISFHLFVCLFFSFLVVPPLLLRRLAPAPLHPRLVCVRARGLLRSDQPLGVILGQP